MSFVPWKEQSLTKHAPSLHIQHATLICIMLIGVVLLSLPCCDSHVDIMLWNKHGYTNCFGSLSVIWFVIPVNSACLLCFLIAFPQERLLRNKVHIPEQVCRGVLLCSVKTTLGAKELICKSMFVAFARKHNLTLLAAMNKTYDTKIGTKIVNSTHVHNSLSPATVRSQEPKQNV